MCTIKQQKNKEVSAILVYRILDIKKRQLIAIHSHPTKQPNTNLIKYGVAIAVTPAYNTTNNSNKLSSHQFIFNVPYNATSAISLFFSCFIVHITILFFLSK